MNEYHTSGTAVLIAVYNGEKYLEEQLESLLGQTCTEWTAYIHDDGSSDRTPSVLQKYADRYPERFVLIGGPPAGTSRDNFFCLFGSVDAPRYMCCDQDDVWLPDKMEQTARAMDALEGGEDLPCLVYTDLTVVDASLRVVAESMDRYQKLNCADAGISHVLVQNVVTGCTMMVNRRLRDMMLQAADPHAVIMHDWWAAMIASQFGVIRYLDRPTILYRQHSENNTGAQKAGLRLYAGKLIRQKAEIQASLDAFRRQAEVFAETFPLPPDSVIAVYAGINTCPKWKRLRIYHKYKIRKTPIQRQLGILLFG
ncbi:MAG: glycosyltransferase family 2 protein [Lachnospiraceae bacterium]|nr:glycosyltransferase family 2 protein [Lachnospiraceae bacterium]